MPDGAVVNIVAMRPRDPRGASAPQGIRLSCSLAEYVAMLIFVFVCCGAATGVAGKTAWVQQVSLTFGLCIFALALTFGRWGLQCNCAVTFGLAIARLFGIGDMEPAQAVLNVAAQLLGSVSGAALLALVKEEPSDLTGALGVNTVAADIGFGEALVGEIIGTFLLMFVVMQAVTGNQPKEYAPLSIGMAVYLAHSFLIPVDGCSINPTRSFGPAVVASLRLTDKEGQAAEDLFTKIWEDHWVFWLGPLAGALLGVIVHRVLMMTTDADKSS